MPPKDISDWCPYGSLNLHTYNYENTECIWCGPNMLAFAPGKWISRGDGTQAWSSTYAPTTPRVKGGEK